MFVQKMKFEEGKELVIGQIPRHLIFQLGYLEEKYGNIFTKFMNFLSEDKSRIKHRFYSFKFPNSCLDENYLGMKRKSFQFSKKKL